MKFTVTFNVSRSLAVDMLAASLFAGAELTTKRTLIKAIEIHLSTFGEAVWPELRGFTPKPKEVKRLKQQADNLLTTHWPTFV